MRINGEHGDKHPLFIFADPPEKIDAPSYNLHLTGRFAVRNVKLLSWNYSTDGVGGISNVLFQDITVHGDTLNLLAIDNLDQDTPWSAKIRNSTLREIDLVLERVTVTGTERGRWWGPFQDREGQPMRSRLRTADPGKIRVRFEDVAIGGVRLESEKDFPNGLETQGDVRLEFR